MHFDNINKRLLNLLQREFPLSAEPYTDLGRRLGIGGDEVIQRIQRLKADGFIRQISPVVDAGRLGYQTTLVAMKVAETQLDEAERIIAEHPQVSHGYERDHPFNVWFTLAIPPDANVQAEFEQLTGSIDAEAAFTLLALKLFKLNVYFDMEGDGRSASSSQPGHGFAQRIELSPSDRLVINELQQDLPLVAAPFRGMAARVNMGEEDFLAHCHSLLERGVMRRFGASLNHRQAGFKANSMTCWAVPPEEVDTLGNRLASLAEVSHCYERKTNPLWQYNLFAMTHAHTRDACREIAARVSCETGFTDYIFLFSTREFKKARVKYLV